MADLNACYFCGAAGSTALEEHPVVPRALDPDDAHQRTVVVCPNCREKLDAVLDTIVEAVDDVPEEDPPWGSHAGVPGAAKPATDRAADPSGEPDPDAIEPPGSLDGMVDPDGSDGSPAEGVSTGGAGGAAGDDEAGEAHEAAAEADAATDGEAGGPPITPTTRKVARLLRNREFPVDRVELEDLAQSAYELSANEAEEAVETIVAHGMLDDEGGELRKPDQ